MFAQNHDKIETHELSLSREQWIIFDTIMVKSGFNNESELLSAALIDGRI